MRFPLLTLHVNFYPRPPRGGRPVSTMRTGLYCPISIHALREEGDVTQAIRGQWPTYFYPRPPRGGRLGSGAMRGGIRLYFYPRPPRGGRPINMSQVIQTSDFYPRPPRGGRPRRLKTYTQAIQFLSTPSARRATAGETVRRTYLWISIHALREEGDQLCDGLHHHLHDFYPRPPRGGRRKKARP